MPTRNCQVVQSVMNEATQTLPLPAHLPAPDRRGRNHDAQIMYAGRDFCCRNLSLLQLFLLPPGLRYRSRRLARGDFLRCKARTVIPTGRLLLHSAVLALILWLWLSRWPPCLPIHPWRTPRPISDRPASLTMGLCSPWSSFSRPFLGCTLSQQKASGLTKASASAWLDCRGPSSYIRCGLAKRTCRSTTYCCDSG